MITLFIVFINLLYWMITGKFKFQHIADNPDVALGAMLAESALEFVLLMILK